ncbi:uncharacterized protein DFL_000660 [Arthrobotrys flagrans]|uniref:Uncharacterized protein n=1 Tax=Arthrobotrys flagrans TaxID=97331 RepID=A0A437AEH7_ARTFL|nr:hypothetical protein DFL_000660 [Arthrobotrys flagrans]
MMRDTNEDSGATRGNEAVKWRLDAPETPPSHETTPSQESSYEQKLSPKQSLGQFLRADSLPRKIRHPDSGYETIPEEVPSEEHANRYNHQLAIAPCTPALWRLHYSSLKIDPEEQSNDSSFQSLQSFESAFVSGFEEIPELENIVSSCMPAASLKTNIDHGHRPSSIVYQYGLASSFFDEGYGGSLPAPAADINQLESTPALTTGLQAYCTALQLKVLEENYPEQQNEGDSCTRDSSPNSFFSAPSPLDDPLSPSCSFSDQASSSDDPDAENCGYREEAVGKIRVLSVIIYFLLLRTYVRNSESISATPLSVSPVSSTQESQNRSCSDSAEDSGEGNSREEVTDGSETSEGPSSNSGSIGQRHNDRSLKRKQGESNDGEDEGGQRGNSKKIRLSQLASLDRLLACPFAKGGPETHHKCLDIGRKNLAGVKERLKRNHFEKQLPRNIRHSRTWEKVFLVCNPDWDPLVPIPDPLNGLAQEPEPLWTVEDTHVENFDVSYISSTFKDNQAAIFPVAEPDIPSQHARFLMDYTSRYVSPPPGPSVLEEAQLYVQRNLGNLFILPLNEAHDKLLQDLGPGMLSLDATAALSREYILPGNQLTGNTGLASICEIDNRNSVPSRTPHLSLTTGFADTCIPSSSAEQTPSLTQSSHTATSPPSITPQSTRSQRKPANEQLSLIVARRPPEPESTESQSPKEFKFDDYNVFCARFENWMLQKFHDPEFSWETMEFTGTNLQAPPNEQIRITNVEELVLEVEMYHLVNGNRKAVVHLVKKDKGKQRAY